MRGRKPTSMEAAFAQYNYKYSIKEEQVAKKGQGMVISRIRSRVMFDATFESFKNFLIDKGKKPTTAAVINEMLRAQTFGNHAARNRNVAIAMQKFIMENYGERVALADIQYGKITIKEAQLRAIYNNLISRGYNPEQAQRWVSENVYGSK